MAKELTPNWFNESEVVQNWIGKFSNPKGYRRNFIAWVDWIGISPEEQLRMRSEQLKSEDVKEQRFFELKVLEFAQEIMDQKKLSKKSGEQLIVAVRSFFSHYNPREKLIFTRGEIKLEENVELKASHKPKWVLDNLELRALFSVSNPRDKPLLLILASTGLSPTDVSQIRIEGLRLYERDREGKITGISDKPVYGVKPREKTDIDQHYILGQEVIFFLEPTLQERGYPKKGNLLTTQKGNPYDQRSINDRLKTLAEKAFGKERAKEFKTKNLRDYYHNGLLLAEINEKVIDSMMGWKKQGAKESYQITEVVIQQAYDKAKEHWSVDGGRQASEDIAKLKGQLGELYHQNQTLTERITEMEENLKQELELGVTKALQKFIPQIEEALGKKIEIDVEVKEK